MLPFCSSPLETAKKDISKRLIHSFNNIGSSWLSEISKGQPLPRLFLNADTLKFYCSISRKCMKTDHNSSQRKIFYIIDIQ